MRKSVDDGLSLNDNHNESEHGSHEDGQGSRWMAGAFFVVGVVNVGENGSFVKKN